MEASTFFFYQGKVLYYWPVGLAEFGDVPGPGPDPGAPGGPPAPDFLLNKLLKKLANTPSLACPLLASNCCG